MRSSLLQLYNTSAVRWLPRSTHGVLFFFSRYYDSHPLTREVSALYCLRTSRHSHILFLLPEYCSTLLREGSPGLHQPQCEGPSGLLPLSPTLTPCLSVSPAYWDWVPRGRARAWISLCLNPGTSKGQVEPYLLGAVALSLSKWINSKLRVKPNLCFSALVLSTIVNRYS